MKKDVELIEREKAIRDVESVMKHFARIHNKKFYSGYAHEFPYCSISSYERDSKHACIVKKDIYLILDGWGSPFKYRLGISVTKRIGALMLLILMIRRRSQKRKSTIGFNQNVAEFSETIDPVKLDNALNQAQQLLDTESTRHP